MDLTHLTRFIKQKSKELNFDLVGITSPHEIKNNNLQEWLVKGYNANMHWIEKRKNERTNIYKYFPEVKSIISLGYNYYTGENSLKTKDLKISNYAWGKDYHIVIKDKLKLIINELIEIYPNIKYRICVDTSPLLEKYWAEKSGLGWISKNTNLINNKIGSWFFLSEILIDLELEYDLPYNNDLCGSCTKCIDQCPTEALEEYVLDSNKCISYLTIEHRGELPERYRKDLNNWIYGCDICQQVCPWNEKYAIHTHEESFNMINEIKGYSLNDWKKLDENKYQKVFQKSAIKRAKYEGLKRNIRANTNN